MKHISRKILLLLFTAAPILTSCEKSETKSEYSDGSILIDGKYWKLFNAGASETNLYGNHYAFDGIQSACPSGWRVPTKDEFASLSAHYSGWTTYLGMEGQWFSGSEKYSSTASAVFFPVLSSDSSHGRYWSSSENDSSSAYYLYFNSGNVGVYNFNRSYGWSVRCLKD